MPGVGAGSNLLNLLDLTTDSGDFDVPPRSPDRPMTTSEPNRPGRRRSRWVSLARACEILGVNESTVRRWADSGEIQVFRTPGGHRRFDEAQLLELVETGGRQPDRGLEEAALSRIRRQLHSNKEEVRWHRDTDADERDALRPLGSSKSWTTTSRSGVDDPNSRPSTPRSRVLAARTARNCTAVVCRSRRLSRRSRSSVDRLMRPRNNSRSGIR